jgi:hypothetical protein
MSPAVGECQIFFCSRKHHEYYQALIEEENINGVKAFKRVSPK